MKTKNQTEHALLELAVTTAANEDGISPVKARDAADESRKPAQKQAWSPYEVWRTRVKSAPQPSTEPAQR
jgi:hypothetical protein